MASKLRLETGLDLSGMKRDIAKSEKELERYAKEKEKLINKKNEANENLKFYKEEIDARNELIRSAEDYEKQLEKINDEIAKKGWSKARYDKQDYIRGRLSSAEEMLSAGEPENAKNLQKYREIEEEIDKIKEKLKENGNAYNDTLNKVKEQKEGLEEATKEQEELNEQKRRQKLIDEQNARFQKEAEKGFKKLFTGAKRFIGGLIGIRAAYGLVRKAASAYMASDSKITKQMEANWLGLGQTLAPIIQWISNAIRKLVTGILYFLKKITGVNYIAKANAAILKKNAEATKKLRKENDKLNASFDEMEVLQDNKSDDNEQVDLMPLFNENDLSDNVKKKIDNIAKALEPIIKFVKDLAKFALDNPTGFIITILGGAALTKYLLGLIGKSGTGGTGLLGVQSILKGLATMGVISIAINITRTIVELHKTREATDEVDDHIDARRKQAKVDADTSKKLIKSGKMTDDQTKKMIKTNKEAIETMEAHNEVVLDRLNGYNKLQLTTKNWTGELQNNINTLQSNLYAQYQELQVLEGLYRAGKLNEEETEDYKNKLAAFNETLNGSSEQAKDTRKWFNYFGDSTEKLAELQAYASNTAREFDAELHTMADVSGVAEVGIKDLNKMIGAVPKNNVIKIKTDGVNEAKKGISGMLDNLIELTKKNFKVKTQVEIVGIATSPVLAVADLGAQTLKKFLGLANGGIVNNPGQGVPISSNIIAGEAGPEAVLPLNETTMTWLAQLIAKNMSVNLTNVTQMNGRQLSKEIKRISANENYAFNI